jgi:hypothetical protein
MKSKVVTKATTFNQSTIYYSLYQDYFSSNKFSILNAS